MQKINNKSVYSLLEVTDSIKATISNKYTGSYWIKAEMNKLNYYKLSGHCYPDLLEKKSGSIVVETKAIIYSSDFLSINQKFLSVLKEPIKDGINILFCANIIYTPKYGLQLQIIDIDPSYSLGELEREKSETLEKIKSEELYDRNKNLKLNLLPKRIAIISVETSKGYSDFIKIIKGSPNKYNFFCMLFPSSLEGDKAVGNIIWQLNRIKKISHHFDAVAIIRGGGGDIGLTTYNNYFLAKAIALFPIPVFTGIGHSTNETIAEMVAFKNAITPTDLANYLIKIFDDYKLPLDKAKELLVGYSYRLITSEKDNLKKLKYNFGISTRNIISRSSSNIESTVKFLKNNAKHFLKLEKDYYGINLSDLRKYSGRFIKNEFVNIEVAAKSIKKDSNGYMKNSKINLEQLTKDLRKEFKNLLSSNKNNVHLIIQSLTRTKDRFVTEKFKEIQNIEEKIDLLSPQSTLKRGFSMTILNGKILRDGKEVSDGDSIKTILFESEIQSTVNKSN